MNTVGKVIWCDSSRGMFKVKCENGRTALVEIVDFIDIELHDTISGNFMEYGETVTLYSEHNDESFEAMIQNLD